MDMAGGGGYQMSISLIRYVKLSKKRGGVGGQNVQKSVHMVFVFGYMTNLISISKVWCFRRFRLSKNFECV